ncbi:MAG: FlgD immunoglobulin-like domain containing protein [Candidatus Eisenbacteria bacterium]
MRRLVFAFALLITHGLGAPLASFAREEVGLQDLPAKLATPGMLGELRSAAARPGVSGPDTAYFGFVPGKVTATNHWGIGKGNFRVYSASPADYGYWGWDNDAAHDNIAEVHGDSLFGWWPVRVLMNGTGGQTRSDDNRPWWALDLGNQANYRINQGAAHQRTFGVIGVWHRDNGSAGGGGVSWAPLNGSTHSLWCGLRRDGDNTFLDPITGNPFNSRPLTINPNAGGTVGGGIGTNHLFPGYGSQWDQLAYRDLDVSGATTIRVKFRFRTNMSTGRGTAANTRTGWFDKDPLEVTANGAAAGNFISSSAAGDANAPIDSFMVYIGAPVNDSLGVPAATGGEWFLASDGTTRRVFDGQRRWFSEVLRANEGLHREIFTTYGNNAEQSAEITGISLSGLGDRVRLVFRNKTNRGFDDQGGSVVGAYSSGGAGAVVIDDIEVALDGGAYAGIGDFETPGQVDNDPGVSPLDAWKSTGKPPAVYHHVHSLDDLIYEDICGPVGGALRICNMSGNVMSAGDHDNSEAAGGLTPGTTEVELFEGMMSPTFNLRNGGGTNEMGIDASIATVTEDYYITYDIYTGVYDLFASGNAWRAGFSAYPASQRDGSPTWSDFRLWPFLLFNPDKQCFRDQEPGLAFGLVRWNSTLAEGGAAYPDSLRMLLQKRQECYRFGISTGCSATDGAYWDNVSLAFVDGSAPPMSINIWDWINDTFTVNGLNRNGVAPGSVAFDTTSALVKTGLNIAQTSGNTTRYHVPGDTTVITALGDNVRIDLVFRISPGPGNYRTLGNRGSGLRAVPTDPATAINYNQTGAGQAFERNFWAKYLNDNGAKGSPGGHPAGATNGGRAWSSLVWNSARCDTAEINLYQISSRGIGVPVPEAFATMYEESDPKFTTLGIARKRCFLNTATATVNQLNTVCDISLTDGWPIAAGYAAENGLPSGQTYEYTRILPDGQFTPGTHVQYFLRREDDPIGAGPHLVPDTNTVFPQLAEGSTDAHRWQQFRVLPDAWKKGAYGGLGSACMLFVDLNDRRGNERVWVSLADSLGATQSSKYGAHNGWHAAGGASVNDPSSFVYNLNEQPGTTWDMYGVKASESLNAKVAGLGVDFSNHASSNQIDNKWSFQGPSLGMLEQFYKVVLILTGDLNSGILGPFNNYGVDDVKMLQDFMLGGLPGDYHRVVWIQGDGFVEDMTGSSLLSGYLHVSLRDPSYLLLTGNTDACVDLVTQSPITTNGDIYGVRNGCLFTDDVLLNGTRSVPSTLYSPAGNAMPPVIAGVFHDIDDVNGEYWQSLVDGWDIENLATRWCGPGTIGRRLYYYNAVNNIFTKICQLACGSPGFCLLDVPNSPTGEVFVDFMNLRNNPLITGRATVDFGLAKADRVEVKVFDVSGRLVRTLADRQFAPGNHSLTWDGADSEGRQVVRGVYFTQVRYLERGFAEARKLTVLR